MTATHETLLTRNPDGTLSGTRVRRDRYDLYRKHLLASVPATDAGISLSDLRVAMSRRLSAVPEGQRGSITWYTMAVKLDLEGEGLIERLPGRGPQRLRAVTP